jgi:IS5 family transposase
MRVVSGMVHVHGEQRHGRTVRRSCRRHHVLLRQTVDGTLITNQNPNQLDTSYF